jgi:hypothetical protein
MKLLNLITRTLNSNFYRDKINNFFKGVIDDIKILNDKQLYYNNPNLIVDNYVKGGTISILKKKREDEYKENYCPTSLFKYFNQSEKANYIMLRVELDKLLEIKNTFYQI